MDQKDYLALIGKMYLDMMNMQNYIEVLKKDIEELQNKLSLKDE